LVVAHTQTGGTTTLADAVVAGARDPDVTEVDVLVREALHADTDDVVAASALILATPENFGYMSGGMKVFLDRIYYPCLDRSRGLPYALVVKAGHDGSGAVSSVQRIVTGLGWREIRPPLVVVGDVRPEHRDAAADLGRTVAASLELGIL
jgi:NAD(P)H-dependent FMN reductase